MKKASSITRGRAAGLLGIVLGLLAPALLVGNAYVSAAHAARHSDPQGDEEKMGDAAAKEVAKQAKFSTDPAVIKRVADIGARIAAIAVRDKIPAGFGNDAVYTFKYTYTVIDSKEVNAFSLPGGHIYIYTGLLNLLQTDDELAGVLGHETTHAAHHHIPALEHEANKMSASMALGVLVALIAHVPPNQIADLATGAQFAGMAQLNNHFSEEAEEDADHGGMIYMKRAGFDPVGMLTMLQRLQDVESRSPEIDMGYLQDHPLTPQRIDAAKAELAELGVTVNTEAIRHAAGAIHAKVVDAAGTTDPAVRLTVGRWTIALLSPANKAEAEGAAVQLNDLLDHNLRNDQVNEVGPEVFAGHRLLLTFSTDDIKVQPLVATPDQLAAAAGKAIRDAIFDIDVHGISAN